MDKDDYVNVNLKIPMYDTDEGYYNKTTHSIDFSFGIGSVAYKVADLLSKKVDALIEKTSTYDKEKDYKKYVARVTTFPFYNGRENGIGIYIGKEYSSGKDNLLFCWSENRNSDDIVVYKNDSYSPSINPPNVKEFNKEFWESKKYFEYEQYNETVDYIFNNILDYVDELSVNNAISESIKESKENLQQSKMNDSSPLKL